MRILAMCAALALAGPASAQSIKDIERAEKSDLQLQNLESVLRTVDSVRAALDADVKAFQTACMKAFGAGRFCSCINERRASAFSFLDYIAITTRTREENNYSKLEPKMQGAYDKIAVIRDECVSKERFK